MSKKDEVTEDQSENDWFKDPLDCEWVVSEEVFDRILEMSRNPPKPTQALIDLMRSVKK